MPPGLRGDSLDAGDGSLIITPVPDASFAPPMLVACAVLALRRETKNHANAPRARQDPSATPTPMPALAPVDRPWGFGTVVMFPLSMLPPGPVRTADVEAEPLTQKSFVPGDPVHVAPLSQQPPPASRGQGNWPFGQPVGETDATDVEGLTVETQKGEVPLIPHVESTLQQPPPNEDAHLKADATGHGRTQQEVVEEAVPLTVVVVVQRTRSVAQGLLEQDTPMAQHEAWLSLLR